MAACLVWQCQKCSMPFLLDAPCRRSVVQRSRCAKKLVTRKQSGTAQRELIDSAFMHYVLVVRWLTLTCTLNREENEAVCMWLKETYPDAVEFLPLGEPLSCCKQSADRRRLFYVFPVMTKKCFCCFVYVKTQAIPAYPPQHTKWAIFRSACWKT